LFDTIPVTSSNTIIITIQKVWNSALDEQVKTYLQRFHPQSQMSMGVMIQQLIIGQLGGVIHTADAVSGDTGRILIEYDNWRIGAVVDGQSIPKTIWVDAISEETICDTDDSNILKILSPLVRGAKRAQSELGTALELEWVSELSGHLWFLQARPLEAQV
jgi:phosphoenolpyruvate synthase/pyruvate phosphate dikinase